MPRDSSGIYTKPSGTTAVFDTTIDPDAFNSVIDDLGAEMTGSVPTDGSKSLDVGAQLKLDAGSASVPALTFSGDLDTGIYSSGANKVAVAVGGVKVGEFDTTGLVEGAWADTASATTVDLGAVNSRNVNITGTTTITAFGTVASGTYRRLKFAGALTLTHNGTSLILPGAANIITAAGDTCEMVSLGAGNWQCVDYQKATGAAIRGVLQVVNQTLVTSTTGTTTVPNDDTIPQNTEGDEYLSLAITPKSATSVLRIDVRWRGSNTAAGTLIAALFQDSTAGALAATGTTIASGNPLAELNIGHYMTSGTTSATTFKVRVGNTAAGTTRMNGLAGSRFLGGVLSSSITITELVP